MGKVVVQAGGKVLARRVHIQRKYCVKRYSGGKVGYLAWDIQRLWRISQKDSDAVQRRIE